MPTNISRVLRGEDNAEKTIIMAGPLSEIFSKELNRLYAKKDPITGEMTNGTTGAENTKTSDDEITKIAKHNLHVESQQLEEESEFRALAAKAIAEQNKHQDRIIVYAVDGDDIEENDIRKFATLVTNLNPQTEAALIVTEKSEDPNALGKNPIIAKTFGKEKREVVREQRIRTIQGLAGCFGVGCYQTLESFVEDKT